MNVLLKTSKSIVPMCINTSETVKDVKLKIKKEINIGTLDFILLYGKNVLDDSSMISKYKIQEKSMITILYKQKGGIIPSLYPSPTIGDIHQPYSDSLIQQGKISEKFYKTTNIFPTCVQHNGVCYAMAASAGYINTARRIYGVKYIPTIEECYETACYSTKGGNVITALQRLEDKFQLGILFEEVNKVEIEDIMGLSVIVRFATSKKGWKQLGTGEFLTFQEGAKDGSHAMIIDGYDFNLDCFLCKNSWGSLTADSCVKFSEYAAHWHNFVKVYFTLDSIKGKTIDSYNPQMSEEYIGKYNGHDITCVNMDEVTATYEQQYICEYHPELSGNLKYVGYKISEWIKIVLNRPKGLPLPIHYYNNLVKKNEWKYIWSIISSNKSIDRINNEYYQSKPFNDAFILITTGKKASSKIKREIRPKLELNHHFGGEIKNRIFKKTNVNTTYVHGEINSATTAALAFIETYKRMYGIRNNPSFSDCYNIANYTGNLEGNPLVSLRLLEEHYHLGIMYEECDEITPEEALKLSIIAKISTTSDGYDNIIKKGELLSNYKGKISYSYWSLVAGIDTELDCLICRKHWNILESYPLINLGYKASNTPKFIKVYFYLPDIIGKTIKVYQPIIQKFNGEYNGKEIRCARMNEIAAKYETDYEYVYHPEYEGDLKYLGYNIDDLIKIKLNRLDNKSEKTSEEINRQHQEGAT